MPDLSPISKPGPPSALAFIVIGTFTSACIAIGFGLVVFWEW